LLKMTSKHDVRPPLRSIFSLAAPLQLRDLLICRKGRSRELVQDSLLAKLPEATKAFGSNQGFLDFGWVVARNDLDLTSRLTLVRSLLLVTSLF
jgi:hypothetical protein